MLVDMSCRFRVWCLLSNSVVAWAVCFVACPAGVHYLTLGKERCVINVGRYNNQFRLLTSLGEARARTGPRMAHYKCIAQGRNQRHRSAHNRRDVQGVHSDVDVG